MEYVCKVHCKYVLLKWKTRSSSQSIWSWVRSMYNSTQEIVNVIFFCPVDNNHWSRGICHAMGQEGTRILSCGGVVGVDDPMQMGSISWRRSRGLADGSERGSGQRPEALRDFAICTIDFHQFFVNVPTRENEHDWYILLSSIAPIRNKSTLRKMTETQNQLCQTVDFYLFSINKYLIYFCMATMASTSTNIVANVVMGLVGKCINTLQQLEKTTSKHPDLPLCTPGQPCFSRLGSK